MSAFGRASRAGVRLLPIGAGCLAAFVILAASARGDDPPDAIADFAFLDPQQAVLVGPRGQVFRSEDGGRRWRRLEVPVDGDLRRVQFLDGQQGWIAGGFTHPYTHRSSGLLLRTGDGGKSWRSVGDTLLPKILDIHFFDERQAWAVVEPSPLFPSGLAWSNDGGRRWAAAPVHFQGGVRCAAFIRPEKILVVTRGGEVLLAGLEGERTTALPPQAGRFAQAAAFADGRLWVVGVGGMILRSDDEGETWRDCSLPPQVGQDYDFSTVDCQGASCQVAGSPGNAVFITQDLGAHWRRWNTESSLPVTRVRFRGGQGWLATATGRLATTSTGGAQWSDLLLGGQRAVVLGIHQGRPQGAAAGWEVIAQCAAEQGYFAGWERWTRRVGDEEQASLDERLLEAASQLHAEPRSVVGRLEKELAEDPGQWTDRLARSIRQWKPDVVVIASDSPPLWLDTVRAAATQAADASWTTSSGLEPWKIKRAAVLGGGDGAVVRISPGRLAPALGQSVGQFAQRARQLTDAHFATPPEQVELAVAWNQIGVAPRADDLLAGILVAPGAPGRRSVNPAAELPGLQRRLQLRRNLEALFERTGKHSPGVLLGQVDQLTGDLPPRDAGDVLYQLAMSYLDAGYADFAADVLRRLTERLPEHRLSEASSTWLTHYYGSQEYRWSRQSETSQVRQAAVSTPLGGSEEAPANTIQRAGYDATSMQPVGVVLPLGEAAEKETDFRAWIARLQQERPELLLDPRIRMSLASFEKRQGREDVAVQTWRDLAQRGRGPWRQAARFELDLLQGPLSDHRLTYVCRPTADKPRLDGVLDEPFWREADLAALTRVRGGGGPDAANVMLAYDDEFLYVAARAPRKTPPLAPLSSPRRRDMDLSRRDHLEVFLDVDRDYATGFRLAFDESGRTQDRCDRDPSWDPTWYVASQQEQEAWVVEAAVSWKSLTATPPRKGDVWLLGLRRSLPEGQQQAWAAEPDSADRGEHLAALRFD